MQSLLTAADVSGSLLMNISRMPGSIVGPVANLLGVVYNILFQFIYGFLENGALGFAIILFTLLVKLILFPLMFNQQKSSYKMQKLQPEMNKIKEKYKDKKDQQSQQKMALEMQKFQKDNGISLMGGCLPMLLQLPILYALYYIFQQAYVYVDVVAQNYGAIADVIVNIPVDNRMEVFSPFALQIANATKKTLDLSISGDILPIINGLTKTEWSTVLQQVGSFANDLKPLLLDKANLETFFGIDLVSRAGLSFPGIIIPIASMASTWFSSKMMTQDQNLEDNPAAGTVKMMNMIMPIMMGVMTISVPAGLGLYWTISNLITMLQQILVRNYFKRKDGMESKGAA